MAPLAPPLAAPLDPRVVAIDVTGWSALAIVVVAVAVVTIVRVLLQRPPRDRWTRFGIFIEHEPYPPADRADDEDEPPPDEQPPPG